MAKVHDSWRVLPHQAIEELAENLWRVQGSLEGMALRRVMTIARLADGRLIVHNAIALDEPSMDRIDAWGAPAYLIVPNGYHRLDAPAFKQRYPKVQVLCPRGARKKVAAVVPVDGTYEDLPADDTVRLETLSGIGGGEGAMIVRSKDGATVVLNDVLFNMPHGKGLTGLMFRHVTQSTGGPRISRIVRWFLMKDRAGLRSSLERLAQTPDLRRIVVSHHRTITDDPAGTLRRVAATL